MSVWTCEKWTAKSGASAPCRSHCTTMHARSLLTFAPTPKRNLSCSGAVVTKSVGMFASTVLGATDL
eukprot:2180063-Amphidinium_carterae.1